MRPRPERAVTIWQQANPKNSFWTASVVIAELLSGIEMMLRGESKKRCAKRLKE